MSPLPVPAVRHAWLQTHPTPAAQEGEFHWYPATGDRELRARCVERMRGLEPPAVLWSIARGRATWAQLFEASSPRDGRRYVGIVLTVVESEGSAPELLDTIAPPAAAPWADGVRISDIRPHGSSGQVAVIAAVARGLLSGRTVAVGDPMDPSLPGTLASIAGTLPTLASEGAWTAGPPTGDPDPLASLIARAWRDPASRDGETWTLVRELAVARAITCDRLATELAIIPPSLTDAEHAMIGASRDPLAPLHAWGRGQLDTSPTAATLVARLADGVALRALARALAGDDPRHTIAEVRWHALLPAQRRTALLAELASRTPSLRALVEHHHA